MSPSNESSVHQCVCQACQQPHGALAKEHQAINYIVVCLAPEQKEQINLVPHSVLPKSNYTIKPHG